MDTRELVGRVLFEDGYGAYLEIRELAESRKIYLASTHNLYLARGEGKVAADFTVPAVNLRGMTYQSAKTMLQVAKEVAGFFIFEIAKSEMEYTEQMPMEYAAEILGAAIDVGWEGPIFLQGDHFQFASEGDVDKMKKLVDEALMAGFYNIDIDGSTLVALDEPSVMEQQRVNISVTGQMLKYLREREGDQLVSVGGEIGHIGERNSRASEMEVFLSGIKQANSDKMAFLSKVSVQTGTRHGGVVNKDGETQEMEIDMKVIDECGKVAREMGVGGVVQHGASTLTDTQLKRFVEHDTLEIHLATGWQNMIMDHPSFPLELRREMEGRMVKEYGHKYNSPEECIYRERKRAWGKFQREVWQIPDHTVDEIMRSLKDRARMTLVELGMQNKYKLLREYTE